MAAEIPNLVKRNGIYYFRCRIPSTLTNGRAREVKISLKTGNSFLFGFEQYGTDFPPAVHRIRREKQFQCGVPRGRYTADDCRR